MQELRKFYKEEARQNVQKKLNLKSIMEVPRITKVVVNMGFGKSVSNKKQVEMHLEELKRMTGQTPVATVAKKSIAGFKIRDGMVIGGMVTLRADYMFGFLSKMIHVVFPRVRQFEGISRKSFDGQNNHTFSVTEQIVFPEVTFDQVDQIRGCNITICMKGPNNREAAILLLSELGWPWKHVGGQNG